MQVCKNSANERKVSLLTICRMPPILYKDSANECKVSLLTICRMPPILYKDIKDIGKKVYFYGVT